MSSGKTVPWIEMRKHLEARVAGKPAKCPVARKLARIELAPERAEDFDRILDHLATNQVENSEMAKAF